MTRLAYLVLLGVSLAGCAGARMRPGSSSAPPNGYLHEPSGRLFPDQTGLFLRGDVTHHDGRGFDTSVGYETMMIAPLIVLTAYVYPTPGMRRPADRTFAQHYAQVQAVVLRAHPDAERVLEEETSLEDRGATLAGRRAVFRFALSGPQGEERHLSEVYLFARGRWFLKYRATYLEDHAATCAVALRAFFHGLPGVSGPAADAPFP